MLPPNVSVEQIEQLKILYKAKVKELRKAGIEGIFPRNLPFYHLLKDKFPSFSWKTHSIKPLNKKAASQIIIDTPRIDNLPLSLLTLLLRDDIDCCTDTSLRRRHPVISRLPTTLGADFADLVEELQMTFPDHSAVEQIVDWLQAGMQGEHLTVFSPVCPDYSFEKVEKNFYRYTFNELRCGVGLVAGRVLDALPSFEKFFKSHHIPAMFVVAIGDFEALVEENLKRLDIMLPEFLDRVRKSAESVRAYSRIPIEVYLFTDLCGGHASWNE